MEKKVLPRFVINYILQQMLGLTFISIMLFLDIYINHDIEWLKIGMMTFTFLVVIIYEVLINYSFKVNKTRFYDETIEEKPSKKPHTNNEKYLWFLLLLLTDLILLAAIVSKFVKIYDFLLIIITIAIFYGITVIVRPYFGVNHNKE